MEFVEKRYFADSSFHISWPAAWSPFLECPWNLRAQKAIFSSSASKNGEVYVPETSWMKRTSVHFKNMWIKQLFSYGFTVARKVYGAFENRAPGCKWNESSRSLSRDRWRGGSPSQLSLNSPGHYQNWIYDFLSSDWLTQNQNIA